jgi:hypothetical protein
VARPTSKKKSTLWPSILCLGLWGIFGWVEIRQPDKTTALAVAEEARPKWQVIKAIPVIARCREQHISVESVYVGQVEWSVESRTNRHRAFAVLLQNRVEEKRWSERTIDQMSKGSGSAGPYSPPNMVVLFSDDHSLPRKGYSGSLRHDRPSYNVVCSTVQATE